MGGDKNFTDAQLLLAIKGSAGLVAAIAKKLKCAWGTAQRYIDASPAAQAAINEEKESIVDMAESVVIGAIQGRDVPTAKWYLATKGKDRGFTERKEEDVNLVYRVIGAKPPGGNGNGNVPKPEEPKPQDSTQ